MTDPVNLNVPGLPYLLFALAFFAVVALLAGLLSSIEPNAPAPLPVEPNRR